MLCELDVDQGVGESGGVDGRLHQIVHHEGHSADVILVPMGEDDAPDAGLVLHKVGDVGDNGVDTVHIVVGEADAAVHHHNVLPVLVDVHVFADLVETAESENFQFFLC